MEILKQYFSKRYFLFFICYFVIWYSGMFLLFTLFEAKPIMIFYVALSLYYPLIVGGFAYAYFKKSINDWNERFIVAFGWIALSSIFSAILSRPVYGYDWTAVMNLDVIKTNWVGIFAIFIAAFLARKKIS